MDIKNSVIGRYAIIRFSTALFFIVLSARSEMQDDKHVLGVAAQTDTTKRCLLRHRVATHRRVTGTHCPHRRFGDFQRSRRPLYNSRNVTSHLRTRGHHDAQCRTVLLSNGMRNTRDFRLPQRCSCDLRSSGMLAWN